MKSQEKTEQEEEIIKCAIAFIDQLNTFNCFTHTEVIKRAIELQEAVGEYWKEYNKKMEDPKH